VDSDMPNLREMTQKIQETQEKFLVIQRDLAELEATGSAGGGLVTVRMRGTGEVTRVVIDQAAVDQGDAESLSNLVLTAMREATEAVRSATSESVSLISDSFSVDLEALGWPTH
jgi:DNA-binding YbaB/EbfC family protein